MRLFWKAQTTAPAPAAPVLDNDRAVRLAWGYTLEAWQAASNAERAHMRLHVAARIARMGY